MIFVGLAARVESGIQAVFGKLESFLDDESRVGVIDQVFFGDALDSRARSGSPRPRNAMSAARANLQEQVGHRRGSREARIHHDHLARCAAAWLPSAHLNPQGWFSAGLPPMINIMSVFLMSIQPLVMAPRPNVGPKLETVGPCQTLA